MTSQQEIERRYANVREAAARDGLDAVVVAGSEYTGFEGAVTYMSGFQIVHRYAYVVIPADGAWAELDDETRERASHRSDRGVSSEAGC